MLKACCVLWHGLRLKAEHHLPRPVMNCMCNKNVGGGVPLTSGDVICLSLTVSAEPILGCSVCYLHRTKVNLYWYVKRLQHKIRCSTGKQQLRVSTSGCTLSKSHILVWRRELNNSKDVHAEVYHEGEGKEGIFHLLEEIRRAQTAGAESRWRQRENGTVGKECLEAQRSEKSTGWNWVGEVSSKLKSDTGEKISKH